METEPSPTPLEAAGMLRRRVVTVMGSAWRLPAGSGERPRDSSDRRSAKPRIRKSLTIEPNDPVSDPTSALPQGNLGLLDTEIARRLLSSTIPARMAYVAADGTPRVMSTWFHWTGEALVMPAFISAPHVRHPASRLRDLRARPDVAVTIDTDTFPPEVLLLRGRVELHDVDGVVEEYTKAAERYLGEDAGRAYIASIDVPGTRMARIVLPPSWVGLIDFQTRNPSPLGGICIRPG